MISLTCCEVQLENCNYNCIAILSLKGSKDLQFDGWQAKQREGTLFPLGKGSQNLGVDTYLTSKWIHT